MFEIPKQQNFYFHKYLTVLTKIYRNIFFRRVFFALTLFALVIIFFIHIQNYVYAAWDKISGQEEKVTLACEPLLDMDASSLAKDKPPRKVIYKCLDEWSKLKARWGYHGRLSVIIIREYSTDLYEWQNGKK